MSNRQELLTPVGRLVQGSLYTGQTTDAEDRPLTYKTGAKAGEPRVNFFFALAIPKGSESHWKETKWGADIWRVGHSGFPNGQADSPQFAWKITDGDSTIPNAKGNKPCDREGYAGNWVLSFSGSHAPSVHNQDGTKQLLEENYVKLGDYIQVYGSVTDNESQQKPGVYLNHNLVAFAGYGQRIITGADPKSVGFGKAPLPAGVSQVPLDAGFNPAAPEIQNHANHVVTAPPVTNPPQSVSAPPPVQPHTGILTPPVPAPVAPARVMLAPAGGHSYESLINAGWTDTLLIQHGYMQA